VDPPQISAINLAEVLDVLVRHQGWPAEEVEEKFRWLTLGGLQVIAVDEPVGLTAGRLHADNYDRRRRPLSLADCAALATALARGQRLATSDPALIAAARSEGCAVIALQDSRGQRPAVGESTGVDG
jgi:PIN domain nuclease of toxin-antitoxin system